jgi:hypothetical protein
MGGFHFTVSVAKKCTAVPEMRFHLNGWERIGSVLREYTDMNFKTYAERTGTTTTATSSVQYSPARSARPAKSVISRIQISRVCQRISELTAAAPIQLST